MYRTSAIELRRVVNTLPFPRNLPFLACRPRPRRSSTHWRRRGRYCRRRSSSWSACATRDLRPPTPPVSSADTSRQLQRAKGPRPQQRPSDGSSGCARQRDETSLGRVEAGAKGGVVNHFLALEKMLDLNAHSHVFFIILAFRSCVRVWVALLAIYS